MLLLPILVFAGLAAGFYVNAEGQRAEERARQAARDLMQAVDRELSSQIPMLQALATSGLLRERDLAGFHGQASEISHALGVTIVLRAPGEPMQVLNTAVPWGGTLGGGNVEIAGFEEEVLRSKQPVISDLITGPVRQRWVVVVMVPVLRNGEVAYFLSVGIPAEQVADLLRNTHLDAEWYAVVLDRKDVVVARSSDHERFVGKPSPSGWVAQAKAPEGTWTGLNRDNIPVLAAYTRSPQTRWKVAVAVPEHVLRAPFRHAVWSLAALGSGLLALAVGLASWRGAALSGAITRLSNAAAALARGEQVQWPRHRSAR